MPSTSPDFADAFERHWQDARTLLDGGRIGNADQLYGFAAECGLKAVMQVLGMRLRADGKPERPYSVHIDKLWDQYGSYLGADPQKSQYTLSASVNPFVDWSASDRYAPTSYFVRERVEQHERGAEQVRSVVERAHRDGLIA